MTPREEGFLLLTGSLGNPDRKVLTVAQFRILASRVQNRATTETGIQLDIGVLKRLGYDEQMALRIVSLLDEADLVHSYLRRGQKKDCVPITRISENYPLVVRKRLGLDSPGCLWAKGDTQILNTPKISLVGSRVLQQKNLAFAREVGKQAARQGFTLVSGNARGADREAQQACLDNGGRVISVVADALEKYPLCKNILYLSEDGFDLPFSTQRALSRNRVIHTLGMAAIVCQCRLRVGGSWHGATQNLKYNWSPVHCFRDGSAAAEELVQLGAEYIDTETLTDLSALAGSVSQIKMEELL